MWCGREFQGQGATWRKALKPRVVGRGVTPSVNEWQCAEGQREMEVRGYRETCDLMLNNVLCSSARCTSQLFHINILEDYMVE